MVTPQRAPILLIVDQDIAQASLLRDYFSAHQFLVHVVSDGVSMRREIEEQRPDLVVLDVHLANEAGLDAAAQLRVRYGMPLILVSTADELIDKVLGLELGADDYVAKPFNPRELLARVRSVLRRIALSASPVLAAPVQPAPETRVRVGNCWFDREARTLHANDGSDLPITAMEFELLDALVRSPNRVLSRRQLSKRARKRDCSPLDRSVDICIGRLRRKLGHRALSANVVQTVRNEGYMFCPG
jgi:two-component system phosphate regulon response regulator OmpR